MIFKVNLLSVRFIRGIIVLIVNLIDTCIPKYCILFIVNVHVVFYFFEISVIYLIMALMLLCVIYVQKFKQ